MRKIFNYFALMIVMVSLALIACGCSENAEGGETDSSKLYDNNGDGNMSTAIDSANGGDASTVDSGDTEDSSVGATPPSSGKEDPPACYGTSRRRSA